MTHDMDDKNTQRQMKWARVIDVGLNLNQNSNKVYKKFCQHLSHYMNFLGEVQGIYHIEILTMPI